MGLRKELEHENASLQNRLCRTRLAGCPNAKYVRSGNSKPAVGGDERLEDKEFENDGLQSGKKCKMVMLRPERNVCHL